MYKPWRRRIERYRARHHQPQTLFDEDVDDVIRDALDDSSPSGTKDTRIHSADNVQNPGTVAKDLLVEPRTNVV